MCVACNRLEQHTTNQKKRIQKNRIKKNNQKGKASQREVKIQRRRRRKNKWTDMRKVKEKKTANTLNKFYIHRNRFGKKIYTLDGGEYIENNFLFFFFLILETTMQSNTHHIRVCECFCNLIVLEWHEDYEVVLRLL